MTITTDANSPDTAVERGEVAAAATAPSVPAGDAGMVAEDLLVEDVSIDGMCGVY